MKKKPKIFYVLSLLCIAYTLTPFYSFVGTENWKLLLDPKFWETFGVRNYLLLSHGLVATLLLWRASSLALVTLPVLGSIAIYNCWDLEVQPVPLASALFLLVPILLFTKSVRFAFFNPQRHWWHTPPRVLSQVPAVVESTKQETYMCTVENISERGLLVDVHEHERPSKFARNEILNLRFSLENLGIVKCKAQVVHRRDGEDRTSAPKYGMRIIEIEPGAQKQIRKFVRQNRAAQA